MKKHLTLYFSSIWDVGFIPYPKSLIADCLDKVDTSSLRTEEEDASFLSEGGIYDHL